MSIAMTRVSRSRSFGSSAGSCSAAARSRSARAVENLTACDRPIGWTQHVTLGPPFPQKGVTEFRASATRSKVFEQAFGAHDDLTSRRASSTGRWRRAWTAAPADLRRFTNAPRVERLHRAPDGPDARRRVLRRLFAGSPPGVRLHLEAARFSVARHLGGEPQPHARAVERRDAHPRHGIRRVADARVAARR